MYAARGACIYATRKLLASGSKKDEMGDANIKKLKKSRLISEENDRLTTSDKKKESEDRIISRPWVPSSKPYLIQLGNKNCSVLISDESGKININKLTDENKANFIKFLTSYKMDEITAETITDSLLDWLDNDDLHHMNGAEKDYYGSLPEPYEPKNGAFESLEELALVKGVTSRIFEMIRDNVTIYGSGKININFAPKEVLLSIPMVTPEIAEAIIQLRKKRGGINNLNSLKDLFAKLGILGKDYQKITNYLTVANSNYMTIHSSAASDSMRSSYKIIVQKRLDNCKIIAVYP